MTLLDKAAILAANDIRTEDVAVPEWGGTVRVKVLSGTERNAWGASLLGEDGKYDAKRYSVRLVAAAVVGEDGAPIFTDEDVPALAAKSGAALARVQAAAERLNGLGAEGLEAARGN